MSKLPRIIFGPEIWSLQSEGGISRYFQELIHGLSDLGMRGKVLAQNYANSRLDALEVEGFEIQTLMDFEFSYTQIAKLLEDEIGGNIFHPTYYSQHLRKYQNSSTRIVVTVHDMISEIFPGKKPRFRKSTDVKEISVRGADHILTVSHQTKNDLVSIYKLPEENISVTYLGSNLHLLPKTAVSKVVEGEYLLYVGKRGGYKNFLNFATAYSRSKTLMENFSIVAVGGGEFCSNELLKLQDLGIADKVIQMDANDHQLAMFYRNATCLVYPSLYEGFGLPPVEAMSLNCPVIASSGGSIPEICKNAVEYFDPADIESIGQTLSTTLGHEQRLSDMRKSGLLVAKQYAWEKTALDTLNVYKKLFN